MSPPSRTSAHAQGPRTCMCSPCLVWQPPSSTSQEQKLISAALSLIPQQSLPQNILCGFYMASYVRFNGLFPVASHRSTVNAQVYTWTHTYLVSVCLSVSFLAAYLYFSVSHTLALPGPDINQYDSKCKENIDPKHKRWWRYLFAQRGLRWYVNGPFCLLRKWRWINWCASSVI